MTEISYSDDDKAKSSKLTHSRTPYICQLASGKPCSSCTDLASFDALDASPMNNSMKERRHLLRRINARHDPLSSHLPSELISQIFLAYHEDTGYSALVESQDDLITRTATPLLLASVCAMWRDIAIDIPSLWSSLLIQDAASWYLYKDLVVQWLDRSKSRPLSIRISADDGFAHRANHLKLATLFEIIRRYADRWQLINVRTTTEIFRMFLGHCYINSPRLETLIFHIVDSAFERAVDIITLKSPQLKTLHMSSACLATVILDWNHLTAVQLKAASIDEILEVLRRAPGLLRCDLARIYDDDAVYTLPATLFHPSLLFLMLYPEEGVEQVVCKALERLTLPHLQRLTYNFKHTSPFNMVIALPFLVRSGREITYLSLEQIEFRCISPISIITILEHLPSLTELRMECRKNDTNLTELFFHRLALAPTSWTPNFLPHLQILNYCGMRCEPHTFKELHSALHYLVRAAENPRPLHTVHFTLIKIQASTDSDMLPAEVFLCLAKIKAAGVALEIHGESWNQGVREELDLLLAKTFPEFDDFPVHWFDM